MTGRYQQRYGVEQPLTAEGAAPIPGNHGLQATPFSLPRLLKTGGYATALVGKWHLGYDAAQSPGAHGFDYFFGLKSGYHDDWHHNDSRGALDLWENDVRTDVPGYSTDLIAARAVRFIEQHAQTPFFIDVSFTTCVAIPANETTWRAGAPTWPARSRGSSTRGRRTWMRSSPGGSSALLCKSTAIWRIDRMIGIRFLLPRRGGSEVERIATAIVPLRLVVGLAVFASEGLQKLLYPAELGAGRFAKIGIPYAEVMGPLVGITEIIFGVLVAIGFRMRLTTLPLIGVMCVALVTTKLPILLGADLWIFEVRALERYGLLSALHEARTDLAMLASLVLLAVVGSGRWSVDAAVENRAR